MSYQLELRYGQLANEEELAIVGSPGGSRQTGDAGNSSTAREFTSLHNQLDSAVTDSASTVTTIPELEQKLLDVHLAVYMEGGNPAYLTTSPALARHISAFAYSAGRNRDLRNERTLVNVVDQQEVALAA